MEKLMSSETINRLGKMIEGLTLEELHTLNRLVVHRVKLFHKVGKFVALSRFSVGETVHFHRHDGRHITGVIERLNQKTASILATDGGKWKVSPELFEKGE